MKKLTPFATVLCAVLVLASTTVSAQDDWKSLKQESKRMKIDETAQESLDTLFADNPKAKELFENSYGWAVFDNLKLAFGFSGGGGNGVAVNKETGEKTYMQMGTAGVGIGLGANKYQIVFLFQDSQTFRKLRQQGLAGRRRRHRGCGKARRRGQDRLHQRPRHLPDDRKGPDGQRRHRRHQVLEERQAELNDVLAFERSNVSLLQVHIQRRGRPRHYRGMSFVGRGGTCAARPRSGAIGPSSAVY